MRKRVAYAIAVFVSLSLAAANLFGQSRENPLGLCMGEKPGALVICGGGRLREEVYQEFLRLAGGKQAHLVHIPSAYNFSSRQRHALAVQWLVRLRRAIICVRRCQGSGGSGKRRSAESA